MHILNLILFFFSPLYMVYKFYFLNQKFEYICISLIFSFFFPLFEQTGDRRPRRIRRQTKDIFGYTVCVKKQIPNLSIIKSGIN